MNSELQRALKRHTQWFGSYKASGELKKLQVWPVVNDGQTEFLLNKRVVVRVQPDDPNPLAGLTDPAI